MLKFALFGCACLCFVGATELEDNCIMEFLKQRHLINSTASNPVYYRRKNCDQIVKKLVRIIYEENLDYLTEGQGSKVDNRTYRTCLRSEFERQKMNEKFLKAKAIDYEPQKTKLETIREAMLATIKSFCSREFEDVASERFKQFISDKGEPSPRFSFHPAMLKIKENLVCMNRYAVDRKLLDPSLYHLNMKLINQTDDGCKLAEYDVVDLIMEEWHIRRVSEDDAIQRCFIAIFLETQAVDLFIKYALLSQLKLTQEQQNSERESFVKSSGIVHEMSYKCMSIGFEKI